MKTCPNCQRVYSDAITVCSKCGTPLGGGAAMPQSQYQPQPQPQNVPQPQPYVPQPEPPQYVPQPQQPQFVQSQAPQDPPEEKPKKKNTVMNVIESLLAIAAIKVFGPLPGLLAVVIGGLVTRSCKKNNPDAKWPDVVGIVVAIVAGFIINIALVSMI